MGRRQTLSGEGARQFCYAVKGYTGIENKDFALDVIRGNIYRLTTKQLRIVERANFFTVPYSARDRKNLRQFKLVDMLFDNWMTGWDVYLLNGVQ